MITRTKVTKQELCDILAERLGVPSAFVVVYACPQLGWDANLITFPGKAANANRIIKRIAARLRPFYQLTD
jgi:hypothetical protein